jgi:hypothetical protein
MISPRVCTRWAAVLGSALLPAVFGCDSKPAPAPKADPKAEVAKGDAPPPTEDGEPTGVYLPQNTPSSKPRRPMTGEPFADYDEVKGYRPKDKSPLNVYTPPADPPRTGETKPTKSAGPPPPPPKKVAAPEPKEHAAVKTVPQLLEDLKGEDAKKRAQALFALARAGAEAKPALPAIKLALKDKDETVRSAAEFALKRIPQ